MRYTIIVDGLRFTAETAGADKVAVRLPGNKYIKTRVEMAEETIRKHKELFR